MLWKAGAVRRPPFHQASKPRYEITPGLFSRANRSFIAAPIRLIPSITSGGMFGFIGSAYGGTKMRAGNAGCWCWL